MDQLDPKEKEAVIHYIIRPKDQALQTIKLKAALEYHKKLLNELAMQCIGD
jgi:hypothetical protein